MSERQLVQGPFRIDPSPAKGFGEAVAAMLKPAIEKTLAFDELNRVYRHIKDHLRPGRPFCEQALETLNVTCQFPAGDLAHIPATGPLVVVANHPFGGLEGVMLDAILRRVRGDVKLLANYMLGMIPDLRESLLLVDPFGREDSARKNIAAMKAAMRWVASGHVLGVFPSGEVSHLSLKCGKVVEGPWNSQAARIARRTGAAVVCVFFEGRNSNLFHLMGLLHRRLRTIMLPRELLRKQQSSVSVRIGPAVAPERIARFGDAEQLTDFLRVRTYVLKGSIPSACASAARPRPAPASAPAPLAPAGDAAALATEIRSLEKDHLLLEQGPFSVLYFPGRQAPRPRFTRSAG